MKKILLLISFAVLTSCAVMKNTRNGLADIIATTDHFVVAPSARACAAFSYVDGLVVPQMQELFPITATAMDADGEIAICYTVDDHTTLQKNIIKLNSNIKQSEVFIDTVKKHNDTQQNFLRTEKDKD